MGWAGYNSAMTVRDDAPTGNGWWIFTLIAAGFTILMLLLEGFGVLHDWGLVLSGVGVVLTVLGSAQAATQKTVAGIDRRLSQMHDTLLHIVRILDERLPDLRTK